MPKRLTTTSYAVLGLLARAPHSAYQLTTYMKQSGLNLVWPRTEAGLYNEPKRLVEHGLARARKERQGGRERTVYSITAAGRRALRTWLEEPGGDLGIQSEKLVQFFFSDAAGGEERDALLRAMVARERDLGRLAREVLLRWRAGELRSPERIHYTVAIADIGFRIHTAMAEWAEDWLEWSRSWPDSGADRASERHARDRIDEILSVLGEPADDA